MGYSYKQEKIIVIMYEYINDKREFFPVSNIPLEKAKFFYKDDEGLFKLMAVSDYVVRTELNEARLYITNENIKENSKKFQIGYEINFKALEYESPLPVLSILVEMYNQLVEDSKTLFNYVKKQCFISDDKSTSLILPSLPNACVWCMGEDGNIFALPISEMYSKFDEMINTLHLELKGLIDTDYSDISKELQNETEKLLKELNNFKEELISEIEKIFKEEQKKIITEGEKQLKILKESAEGLSPRVDKLEKNKFDKGAEELPDGYKTAFEISNRIKEVPGSMLVEDDEELTNSIINDPYKQDEIYDVFVEEKECFSINQLEKIKEIMEKESSDIVPDEKILADIRKLPNENLDIVHVGQEYLIDGKIKTYRNIYNIKNVYRLGYSCIIRTFEDELYSFGYNGRGGLGIGNVTDNAATQKTVHKVIMPDTKARIKEIFNEPCSENLFILYDNNDLYALGANLNGSLGLGHTNVVSNLTKVPLHFSSPVKMVSSSGTGGWVHSTILLLENGEIYVCGSNDTYGALGLGNGADQTSFKKVTTEFDGKPVQVKAQGQYNHTNTFVVTDKNSVYTAGYNGYYIIGNGNNTNMNIHTLNTELKAILEEDEYIIKLYSLVSNVFIVTNKNLYGYGYNRYYIITPDGEVVKQPVKIKLPRKPVDIVDIQLCNYVQWIESTKSRVNNPEVFILFKDGSVYECGYRYLKVNKDLADYSKYLTRIAFPYKVIQISCGATGISFLNEDGRLFYAGNNSNYEGGTVEVSATTINNFVETQIGYIFDNDYSQNKYIKDIQKDDIRLIES